MSDTLEVPLALVVLRGIRHELDATGSWCETCGELAEHLLSVGGAGEFA